MKDAIVLNVKTKMLHCHNGKVYRTVGIQVGSGLTKEAATQYASGKGSCQRRKSGVQLSHWTYDDLKERVLCNRDILIRWLMDEESIASNQKCPTCSQDMELVECTDRSDGYMWECRRQVNNKQHRCSLSIRKGGWFEESNMTLEEVIQFTYWWTEGLIQ